MRKGTIGVRPAVFCFTLAVAMWASAARENSYAQERPKAAVFYMHGRIYTNDPASPWAEAMAVADGKITCIGKMAHVLLDCGGSQEGAETVPLHEQFVMPGFNDAHVHLGSAGADALSVELRGVTSPQEMQKRVAEAVAHHKEGEWITGSGWDHTLWPDKRFPNHQQLDPVAPKNPVLLTHISGHVAVANSLALKIAEIDKSTPNPPGGEIEHDGLGEPTGMLKEDTAMALVRVRIPDPSMEERRRGIEIVLQNVARNGVTSVQDNSAWEDFQVYQELKEEGKLTARITEWLHFNDSLDDLQNRRAQGGTTDLWLKTGALKAVTDGALGSRTAAMLEPYSDDPSATGIFTYDRDKLRAMAIERIKGAYAWNTMLKNGVSLAFGTDYPVEPISPFRGLYACVTRERPEGGPRKGWEPQEKISLEDCIRAYTSGSAYAQFEEGKKGALKVGEYADFLILSDDLTKIPPAGYTKMRVLQTVVGGKTVYP